MIELRCGVCGRSYMWPAILGYSAECEALRAKLAHLRDALQKIADAPRLGYVPAGGDCGNSGDIYLDGEEAGLRHCAEIAKNALARGGTR